MFGRLLNTTNISPSYKSVTLRNGNLSYRLNVGNGVWQDTPLTKPFAFDFGSLQHGWVRYPPKGSGERAQWDLRPTDQKLPDETRDGWFEAAAVLIASAELGGVARLEITKPVLAQAVMDLYGRYVGHFHAAKDWIPVVQSVVDDVTALTSFEIKGWRERPTQFGERLNAVPQQLTQAPCAPPRDPETGNDKDDVRHLLALMREEWARAHPYLPAL